MSKFSKIPLYIHTVSHLKPSQVLLRVRRRTGGLTQLKGAPVVCSTAANADVSHVPVLPQLDFCPSFLERFNVEQIIGDEICILHHTEKVDWQESWHEKLSTPLWRFNLQYFEYLVPLAKAYLNDRDERYLEKGKHIIDCWIEFCPQEKGGPAWDSYPIALRIVNWLAFYAEMQSDLAQDAQFVQRMNDSLLQQYAHLSKHLETDLLANHYLEDLKALTILACYFDDRAYFDAVYAELKAQVAEQMLLDGMHFELSPMYHKIIFEDLLRVATCVRAYDSDIDVVTDMRLQGMADCLYSMERNTNRTPLFNDAGDNVAKGKDSLLECAWDAFGVIPQYKNKLDSAGYCFLERETANGVVKLIFDAGQVGPDYALGHAHCDALSIECFVGGDPWIVNMGTYAYQDARRLDYKATCSHSTICVQGEDQHECWAPFRVARYGKARLVQADETEAEAEFTYPSGKNTRRKVRLLEDGLEVTDAVSAGQAISVFHITSGQVIVGVAPESTPVSYAPDFGRTAEVCTCQVPFEGTSIVFIPYPHAKREEGGLK